MIQLYRQLFRLLDRGERRNAAILLMLMLLVALVETAGVASVAPFIGVLANPDIVEANPFLAWLHERLGSPPFEIFALLLGLAFVLMILSSLALMAMRTWAQLRFSYNRSHRWSTRLFGAYLQQPYEWFLNQHSSGLSTSILSEVNEVVQNALTPAVRIIAQLLVVVFLLSLMLLVDPILALLVLTVFGGGFTAIGVAFRKRLTRIGVQRREANRARFNVAQEAFGGLKDVKMRGLEDKLVPRFQKPAQVVASRNIMAGLLSELPSLAMQGMLVGGMLLALMYLMLTRGGFAEALPVIALFALAGMRLLPAFRNIYSDVTMLRFTKAALDALCDDLTNLQPPMHAVGHGVDATPEPMPLQHRLLLDNVSYTYPRAAQAALSNLTMEIPAFTTVGLVGTTGAGKTTLVDVVLGLLRPQSGCLRVDDRPVTNENLRSWQRSVGYVPQQIFLADDSVAGNIAFGLAPDEIDLSAVERAARIASLHEFVIDELAQGYQTHVGERGVRLSGGQRQRIGIARALYHDPDVLILDEATSALDNLTEKAIMGAVHHLSRQKTIILIAHRLTTVKNCDQIYLLEHGRLVAQGRFDELAEKSELFRTMSHID